MGLLHLFHKSTACWNPPAGPPHGPSTLSCGDFRTCGWMDGWNSPPPASDFSSQNTTSPSQEPETKSRAGEKTLFPPCFHTVLAGSFILREFYDVEREGERWRLNCKFISEGENQLKLTACIVILDFFLKSIPSVDRCFSTFCKCCLWIHMKISSPPSMASGIQNIRNITVKIQSEQLEYQHGVSSCTNFLPKIPFPIPCLKKVII